MMLLDTLRKVAELKGSYPLEAVSRVPADGEFLVLTVELTIDGVPWLGAAPAFVGR